MKGKEAKSLSLADMENVNWIKFYGSKDPEQYIKILTFEYIIEEIEKEIARRGDPEVDSLSSFVRNKVTNLLRKFMPDLDKKHKDSNLEKISLLNLYKKFIETDFDQYIQDDSGISLILLEFSKLKPEKHDCEFVDSDKKILNDFYRIIFHVMQAEYGRRMNKNQY